MFFLISYSILFLEKILSFRALFQIKFSTFAYKMVTMDFTPIAYSIFSHVSVTTITFILIHSGYLYSASPSPLLLRGAPDYIIDTVSELTPNAAGNCELRTCPRSLRGGYSGIRTCDLPDERHRIYH